LPPADKHGISYVGSLAASAIVEQLLQSSLRLHHTGGTWEMEKLYDEIFDMMDKGVNFWPETIERDDEKINLTVTDASAEDLEALKTILIPRYYKEDEIEFIKDYRAGVTAILPHVRLPNQDTSRILREFSNLVYRKREKNARNEEAELIHPQEMYSKVIDVVFEGAYLLSVYVEVILSALFFDEEMNAARYSDNPIHYQVPLKSVIHTLDPKLSVFYKLNNQALKNIYTGNSKYELDHMMYNLIDNYK
jgi:hypothetical protein